MVGGGYAGASLAYKLLNRGDVILIDPRDAMHHNMSALRYESIMLNIDVSSLFSVYLDY